MTVQDLPALNASLNASAACFLVAGFAAIRLRRIVVHRVLMGSALLCSTAFLASYLVYHWHAGSRPFPGTGPVRVLYFSILLTHTVLAILNLPMVLRTLYLATTDRFEEHRRAARWALPIWLYVSVTGVAVYWMLYRMRWA